MPRVNAEEGHQRYIPADKNLDPNWLRSLFARGERKAYCGAELETIGMPCGGIGAGELYVRGDGTLAHWWIFNNARNYGNGGSTSYSTYRPPSLLDQGFMVRAEAAGERPHVCRLSREDFDDIRFFGEYPIATIEYRATDKPELPVAISLEAFSPFIPLNARDSASPATVMRFTVANTSKRAVDVDIAGWLQNGACLELAGKCIGDSLSEVRRGEKHVSVQMQLVESSTGQLPERRVTQFDDFEDGTYDKWTVEGRAFGDRPVNRSEADPDLVSGYDGKFIASTARPGNLQGKLVSKPFRITGPYLCYYISRTRPRSVKLFVDDLWVRTNRDTMNKSISPEYWDVAEHVGRMAHIEIVANTADPILVGKIYLSNVAPDAKAVFPEDDGQLGDMALAVLDHDATAVAAFESWESFREDFADDGKLAGAREDRRSLGEPQCCAVASGVRIEPGRKKHVTFLVSWYFPRRHQWSRVPIGNICSTGEHVGHKYATWFDSSVAVADHIAANFERLYGETRLFRDTYFDTTLPYWFVQRIGMPASTMAASTCWWRKDGRLAGCEGVACCVDSTTHVWNYAHAIARLFPKLERSLREKQDLGDSFDPRSGAVHYTFDGQAGAVLKVYREHLMSADSTFLETNWPRTRLALEFLMVQDGDDSGLIEGGQPQTYDGSFVGANTFVGSLYMAALRAGEEMARLVGNREFAEQARRIFENGREGTLARLWNGEYFIHDVDRNNLPPDGHYYADGCLSDQVFGQGWAHQVGLGYIYPRENVLSALRSVWKYNWAPDVGAYNGAGPFIPRPVGFKWGEEMETEVVRAHEPWRWFVAPGEPGLLTCTWPRDGHLGNRAVNYCNEVWTGIEYQVAGHMLYEGMVVEALTIVRGVHDRYNGAKHNPWNEIECGDHYARAMASWGCLLAVSGYLYDGPAGKLGFAPRMTPEDFRCFFSAAEGWGSLEQEVRGNTQSSAIAVKYGTLSLRTLVLEVPVDKQVKRVEVTAGDNPTNCEFTQDDRKVTVELSRRTTVERGRKFEARLHW